jgi:3-oxoacyl-[acyl-carrier-protein] synthase II
VRRVVVTGMAGLSPLGSDWSTVRKSLLEQRSAVEHLPELGEYKGMDTRLAARVRDFEVPEHYPRKRIRSMGRVALLATRASELALIDAGLDGDAVISDGRTGISYGSTAGSPPAMEVFALRFHAGRTLEGIRATDYVQFMSHTVAANLAQFLQVRGRVLSSCSACTSGSQGIGFGYEMVQSGKQDVALAGGAEEYHPIDSAVFDIMFATSKRNDAPHTSPRPFDRDRDGLVVAEGAATLVLEELEHARARGARIHAEVVGYGTNCDGQHITAPHAPGMQRAMELALEDAHLDAAAIGYVNAHGTATPAGDIAESEATSRVFGERMPISSLKSYMGHTLGACGALEAWMTIGMLNEGWFAPTLNLDNVEPLCAPLDYIRGDVRKLQTEYVVSNNFAFGGINTSLVFRRFTA